MKVKTLIVVYDGDVKKAAEHLDDEANTWFAQQDMNAIRVVSVTNELLFNRDKPGPVCKEGDTIESVQRVAIRMIHYVEENKHG